MNKGKSSFFLISSREKSREVEIARLHDLFQDNSSIRFLIASILSSLSAE